MQSIILASQSPRRRQLLEWAEIPFEVVVKGTDERYPADLNIEEIPIYIAREKAIATNQMISKQSPLVHSDKIILAADTVVVLEDRIIGKPKDRADAVGILSALSGKTHLVVTGVVILHNKGEVAFSDTTSVAFHGLTEADIEYYIDKYKPYDKAGAYAIQEWIGVTGIHSIKGDFYNVMGLPVSRVVQELKKLDRM